MRAIQYVADKLQEEEQDQDVEMIDQRKEDEMRDKFSICTRSFIRGKKIVRKVVFWFESKN